MDINQRIINLLASPAPSEEAAPPNPARQVQDFVQNAALAVNVATNPGGALLGAAQDSLNQGLASLKTSSAQDRFATQTESRLREVIRTD